MSPAFCGLLRSRRSETAFSEEALECYGFLARSALAPLVDHRALASIARIARLTKVPAKHSVYSADAPALSLYLLAEGLVELYKVLPDASVLDSSSRDAAHSHVSASSRAARGSSKVEPYSPKLVQVQAKPPKLSQISFRVLSPGHWFGQCAALGLTARQCSARALQDSRVLTIDWAILTKLLHRLDVDLQPVQVMLGVAVMKELRRAPFLHGLTREQASLLATLFHPRHVLDKAVVFEEGEMGGAGPSLFFCNSGGLTMHQSDTTRGSLLVRHIQADQFFGEACTFFRLPRIATVRAVTDCWLAELPFSAFATFLNQFPDVQIDVTCAFNQQAIPTQHLLSNPHIMKGFAEFVVDESSLENVEFWMAARKFRQQPTRNKALLWQDARALYDKFVCPSAEKQINVNAAIQQTLQKAIDNGCITKLTFEEAEVEILRLMDMDTFSRFRFSENFNLCLQSCRNEQVKVKKT